MNDIFIICGTELKMCLHQICLTMMQPIWPRTHAVSIGYILEKKEIPTKYNKLLKNGNFYTVCHLHAPYCHHMSLINRNIYGIESKMVQNFICAVLNDVSIYELGTKEQTVYELKQVVLPIGLRVYIEKGLVGDNWSSHLTDELLQ